MCDQVAPEALVAPAVPEPRAAEEQAEPDGVEAAEPHRRTRVAGEHRRAERGPEERVGIARRRALHPDGEAREVAGRRPEACGGELRVDVPPALDRRAVRTVRGRSLAVQLVREGLCVAAPRHAERLEHELAHQLRERSAGGVLEHLLQHHRASAGVAELDAGQRVDPDARRVRGGRAGEDLRQRGQRAPAGVAGKPAHREARAVARDLAQRHARLPGRVRRDAPRREHVVDVCVEVDDALLDEPEHPEDGDRLGDRARLEARDRGHRIATAGLLHAVGRFCRDLGVRDQRERDARDRIVRHPLAERRLERREHPQLPGQPPTATEVTPASASAACAAARRASGTR